MEPFNKRAKCLKCGCAKVRSMHWRAGEGLIGEDYWGLPERIARRCECCNYSWNEHPLDYNDSRRARRAGKGRK